MISMIKINRTIPLCNGDGIYQIEPPLDRDKRYTTIYSIDSPERIAWLWTLYFATITPELFVWCRSAWICLFNTYRRPKWRTFLTVFTTETFNAIGISLLIFLILPTIDSITGAMITNSLCLIPGLLLLLLVLYSTVPNNNNGKIMVNRKWLTIIACLIQLIGLICWPIIISYTNRGSCMYYWYLPVAMILVSFTWWENYVDAADDGDDPGAQVSNNPIIVRWLATSKHDLQTSRYFTYLIVSLWKCLVILSMMILIEYLNEDTATVGTMFSRFGEAYRNYQIAIQRDKSQFDYQTPIEGNNHRMQISDPLVPVWVLVVQIMASYMCYAVGKFSCKICIQCVSFAVPVNMAVPFTVSFLWAMVSAAGDDKCQIYTYWSGFQYIYWYSPQVDQFIYDQNNNTYTYTSTIATIIWLLSLSSQLWIAIHIWYPTSERLATTDKLFIIPMYSSVVIDQSLAMNRRRRHRQHRRQRRHREIMANDLQPVIPVVILNDGQQTIETAADDEVLIATTTPTTSVNVHEMYETFNEPIAIQTNGALTDSNGASLLPNLNPGADDADDIVNIYVCITMWHESIDEMLQTLMSVLRLDADQCARRQAYEYFQLNPSLTDYYQIEFNIFFDDAFDQLVQDIDDNNNTDNNNSRIINRFVRQLIETVDKAASNVHEVNIRLPVPNIVPTPYGGKLEWTLPGQNKLIAHLKDRLLIRHRKRWSQCMYMYYLLGYRLAGKPMDERRKETVAMNTFILALDGDINFRPTSMNLLVDLMKKNKKLGAACGRIHPIGGGPMVWYQKFEYAICHWLQKTTEHVFGCVLCSPGCFSLFRARAVMDDSVMNKYTTKPSEARHYVQYDQGEDRWLCTLLIKQGWRIEYCAASDSYTHAPEGFGEFYQQRRRWAPSTMANIMDLLGDYKQTIAVNNNISKLYVLYQAMMMIGTVLSPGTIFLMVVGAVNIVLGYTTDVSIVLNLIPVLLFSIVCIVIKNNDHIIFMAMLLSIVYSMVMLAVYVGISIDMFHKTVFTPNSMFFMGLMGSFIVAAILHPQEFGCIIAMPLYMLLIPSMYLLLTIYSVTNMHVVTWGTREVKSKLTATVSTDDTQQSDSDITVANKPMANKSLLGYLNLSQLVGRGSDGRSGFGIITCMCCSPSQRPDDDNDNNRLLKQTLTEITGQLAKVTETVASIKSWTLDHQFMGQSSSDNHQVVVVVEEDTTGAGVGGNGQEVVVGGGQLTTTTTTTNCKQLLLNRLLNDVEGAGVGDGQSTIAADNNHHTTMVTIQDTGAVGSDGSVGHTPSSLSTIAESKQQLPQWIVDDRILKHLPIVPLNDDELDFWQTFIPKYLLPLDDDPVERDRMARDLLLLRNKWVFTFGLLNTIFILVVLLLQTHPEIFNFDIKLTNDDDDDDGYNITGYNNNNNKTAADNNKPMYSYMKMDPIGLVLVVFFGIILVIQLIVRTWMLMMIMMTMRRVLEIKILLSN
ncbi:chitin synthase chs-2-like [Oppia nitens]|uniref:chitin synthase chs-2-like n=1 Tax=Oppia nitens TaxID=1686743 RepID=UPI0023DCC1DD|nr:chitin synthase chs-2-like [Oppia nitens]